MKSDRLISHNDCYKYTGIVRRIVDGDTVIIDFDLGFKFWFFEQRVRLYGINTPEINADGLESKKYLERRLLDKEVIVQTIRDKKEKYGRFLAVIWVNINGNFCNINDLLVEKGYAIYYDPRST